MLDCDIQYLAGHVKLRPMTKEIKFAYYALINDQCFAMPYQYCPLPQLYILTIRTIGFL